MDRILVQDVEGYNIINAAVLHEDASLEEVLDHLVRSPGPCGVFLVVSAGIVAGVITRSVLVRWVRVCMSDLSEHVSVGDTFKMVSAAKARDLAVVEAATPGVRPTDPLSKVLHQITSYNVGAIPVVDADGHVTGDITIGQVLLKALEVRSY